MAAFKDLIASDKPVLIDFFAEWCGPCKTLAPIIKQAKEQLGSEARLIKIDIDKNPELASKLSIQGVPTLMIFKHGELKWRQSGIIPAAQIVSTVKQFT
jgi:thioredoxin 1